MNRYLFTAIGLLLIVSFGLTQNQELPPGPTPVYRTAFDVTDPPESFEVITIVLEFAPGAWTPMHIHGGPGNVLVLEGEVTRSTLEGEAHVYRAGESWLETGEVEAAGNDTDQPARVVFTILLPEGAQVTTPHTEP
jgi:quercetin dioxygenase-like cupin family protein